MALKNLRQIQNCLTRSYCSKKEDSSSIWSYFKSGKKEDEKPSIERCRKKTVHREDPDLSGFGGQAYRTCGSAYVIQKDTLPPTESKQSEEDRILAKMEADLTNKDTVYDPMPPFHSVEKRLIDLTERKLHPFYKRLMSLPKKDFEGDETSELPYPAYKCKCGPIAADEIPDIFNFNKQLLEKKNIFADFKRVELPKQMLMRIIEMSKNRKPTLEKKELEKKAK